MSDPVWEKTQGFVWAGGGDLSGTPAGSDVRMGCGGSVASKYPSGPAPPRAENRVEPAAIEVATTVVRAVVCMTGEAAVVCMMGEAAVACMGGWQ